MNGNEIESVLRRIQNHTFCLLTLVTICLFAVEKVKKSRLLNELFHYRLSENRLFGGRIHGSGFRSWLL